jgi:hypothetical protein
MAAIGRRIRAVLAALSKKDGTRNTPRIKTHAVFQRRMLSTILSGGARATSPIRRKRKWGVAVTTQVARIGFLLGALRRAFRAVFSARRDQIVVGQRRSGHRDRDGDRDGQTERAFVGLSVGWIDRQTAQMTNQRQTQFRCLVLLVAGKFSPVFPPFSCSWILS